MIYKEITADVTKMIPEYVSAHCISNDCAMGAGVVLAFRKVFPGLKEACKAYMKSPVWNNENKMPVPYRHQDMPGVIYNMFTKDKFWLKAGKGIDYEDYLNNLKLSLKAVKQMMYDNGETKLAMPKIGSGLDRCKWEDVRCIIYDVFQETDFEILICSIQD